MKKHLFAAAIASLSVTAANAADMGARTYTKVPAMISAPSWTGFYAGVNVGYGFNDPTASLSPNDLNVTNLLPATGVPSTSYDVKGVLGGVQAGYNWQVAPQWLLGLEADFQGSDIKGGGTASFLSSFAGIPYTFVAQQTVEWFGTVRARAGWLATDNLLVFATGGLAYGGVKSNADVIQATNGGIASTSGGFTLDCAVGTGATCLAGGRNLVQVGYAVGGGLEYAFWRNVTVKADYLYVNLGSTDVTSSAVRLQSPGFPASSVNAHFTDLHFNVVRLGMNYRF